MSGASSEVSLSFDVGKEKSVLWLDTYYFNVFPHNILNMNANVIWTSEKVRPPYVDILLEFQFVRISELEFRITCIRNPISFSTPGGYKLQFQCSINVFDEDPKVFEMQCGEFIVFERFWLNASYRHDFSPNDLNKVFEFKILVKMIEYDCASNKMYLHQEEEFRKIKERYFNSDSVMNDLCYILHIPRLQDVFTGRQNSEFATLKSFYITRAATFSKEIADYIRAKDSCISVPLTDLGQILSFILNGEREPIIDKDLVKIYYDAHRMGLNFLVDLSRDCILGRLANQNFVIDALQVADRVNDGILFEKVAEKFHSWDKGLLNSEGFIEILRKTSIQNRFMVLSLERRLKKIESGGRVEVGEPSKSSPLKFISLE